MENTVIESQPKKSCKKCNSAETLKKVPKSMIVFTIYFLMAAVYGTIEIVKDIISLF
jgi:hypothetical protein